MLHDEIRLEYQKTVFGNFGIFHFKGGKWLNFEKFGFLNITQLYYSTVKKFRMIGLNLNTKKIIPVMLEFLILKGKKSLNFKKFKFSNII